MGAVATLPFRIDLGGGVTDIPVFTKAVGSAISAIAIDLYYDRTFTKKVQIEVQGNLLPNEKKTKVAINGKDLQNGLLTESFISKLIHLVLKDYPIKESISINYVNDLPSSTGLGGSAVTCVATMALIAHLAGLDAEISKIDLIRQAHKYETKDLGIVGGFQDYVTTTFGGYNYIDFSSLNDLREKFIGKDVGQMLHEDTRRFLDENMVLILQKNNNISSSVIVNEEVEFFQSQQEQALQLLHSVKESNEIINKILVNNGTQVNWEKLGVQMRDSWQSQKQLSRSLRKRTQLSNVELQVKPFAFGIRGPGAGINSLFLLTNPYKRDELEKYLQKISDKFLVFYCRVNTTGLKLRKYVAS